MHAVEVRSPLSRGLVVWIAAIVAVLATFLVPTSANADATTPLNISAESLGNDTVQVSWDPVTGATGYIVEYSTSSKFSSPRTYQNTDKPLTTHAYIGYSTDDTTGARNTLTKDTKYYFRVYSIVGSTNSQPSSSVSATPSYEYGAVDDLAATNIGSTFVEMQWVFNEATLGTPGWRIRAENVANRDESHIQDVGSDPVGKISGLQKNSSYYIWVASLLPVNGDAPAVRVGPYSKAIKVKTSNYDVDSPLALNMTLQEPTQIRLAWTPPANMPAGDKYVVEYATSSSMSKATAVSATADTNKLVTGLSANVNYYMRVHVVDASGKTVSDTSDVLQTKTPTARGTITGNVTGIPGADRKDLVVTAYSTRSGAGDNGNLIEESDVPVDPNGNYQMAVRPGTYRVRVSYTGSENYTSLWSGCSSVSTPVPPDCSAAGSVVWAYAKNLTVATNASTVAPVVTLGGGGKVSGTVSGITTFPSNGSVVLPSVDVTARSCWSEGSDNKRDVMAITRTDSNGNYTLDGLADGPYWLRWVYNSGDGFEPFAAAVLIKNHQVVYSAPANGVVSCLTIQPGSPVAEVNPTMQQMDFRTKYAIHVYGTRKVGTTLTTKINKWIGAQYGVSASHSAMTWVFTRNGVEIPGTRGDTVTNSGHSTGTDYCSSIRCTPKYKLASADRGKSVSLQVTYGTNGTDANLGYIIQTKTYTPFKVR